MTTNSNKNGFYIGVSCPGCGGELELEADFFTLTCKYCGSILRVKMPETPPAFMIKAKVEPREIRFGIDRYLKSKNLPLTDSGFQTKYFYYPYWKVNALLLKVRNKMYEKVVSEESDYQDRVVLQKPKTEIGISPYLGTVSAGRDFEGIPDTIGLRTEYVRMIPFSAENIQVGYDSLPVIKSIDAVWTEVVSSVMSVGGIAGPDFGTNLTELMHPEYELVYFPYCIVEDYSRGGFNRFIVDGLSGRVVKHLTALTGDEQALEPETTPVEFGKLDIDFHRCYNCGVDLPDEKSIVYICKNCQVLNILENIHIPFDEIAKVDSESKETDLMLPFWSLKTPAALVPLVGRLFGGLHRSDRIVVPAFKAANFEALYRLSKRMSAAVGQFKMTQAINFDRRFRPVNLRLSEAVTLANVLIYREQLDKRAAFTNKVERVEFKPTEAGLFFAPFHHENYFYVDSTFNAVTFEKTLVS
ncbi:MAG: hypothetical protein ACOYVF_14690 [Candidatus Zixiibacteriota bacterium]